MKPDGASQAPLEESEGAILERIEKSREAALEKCWTACEAGYLSQIKESFEHLGDINVKRLLRRTIERNWLEATRCLLEQGADPNTFGSIMLSKDCRSLAMFQLLGEFGMDYQTKRKNILVYVLDRREILDWLLDQGLDINRGGNTFLPGANTVFRDNTVAVLNEVAAYGDINLFDHLVARGAKPSQSNAIHHAASSRNAVAMITHLVEEYHMDVNAKDGCGGLNELVMWHVTPTFPLKYAIRASNLPAAEVLLKYGANVVDACASAIIYKYTPAVKLLLDNGADPSENLGHAITKDYFEGVQLCLEYGGDIATGELYDKNRAAMDPEHYNGMSSEMRKLLDKWK